MEEIPLSGGTVATVVRVGDTVRRSMDRWSPAVHGVLTHLEEVGFTGSPRFLGIDDAGREILSWIEGTPATRPWPPELLTLDGVREMGLLLRSFHDAIASYRPPPDAEWWIGRRELREGELIIHSDLGAWNSIWRDGHPVAFIDWDFVEPALPIADLAEMAFFVTPMGRDEYCADCGFEETPDRRARLRAFCDSYGWDDVEAVLDAVEEFWELDIDRITTFGPQGITPWAGFLARGLPDGGRELLDWVRGHRRELI